MNIERYGIRLVKIRQDHIEEVRRWRNAPEIRDFMEYREYITPEMQLKWFNSLDETRDFFFVIEYHEERVGLIHTSNIDWERKEGHSGLFIWKKALLSTHIPVLASLSMVDFFFCYCNLKRIYAKVMRDNKVAVKYNKNLGFKLADVHDQRMFQEYVLEEANYFEATERLHSFAERLQKGVFKIEIENELFEQLKSLDAIKADKVTREGEVLSLVP